MVPLIIFKNISIHVMKLMENFDFVFFPEVFKFLLCLRQSILGR